MTVRPEAARIADPEITLKPGADDPTETVVKTAKVERRTDGCPHGLAYIVVDGEHWHHEDGADEFAFVECARQLLPARKVAR